jgi:hypothetical protein
MVDAGFAPRIEPVVETGSSATSGAPSRPAGMGNSFYLSPPPARATALALKWWRAQVRAFRAAM